MRIYVFDDGLGELSPLTDLRPSFDVRTGALTAIERLFGVVGENRVAGLIVPDRIAAITGETHKQAVNVMPSGAETVLLVNGRWALPDVSIESLVAGEALIEKESQGIMAACVRPDGVGDVLMGEAGNLNRRFVEGRQLLSTPWHFRAVRDEAIRRDLDFLTGGNGGAFGATIDPTAKVHASAVLETERGHVVIAKGAVVRPGATIIGPAYVGPHSVVAENAVIRANTAIGPVCKAGGEVSGVVFQGYANKGHVGFLGDSWVGEWVNLGAGTVNSNLLNTYGEIVARATPTGRNERTGEQFLGATIGDHVKTAINTRIMTGSIIGTGTMWAATAPVTGWVQPFTWGTDKGTRRFGYDKFVETVRAMMARRDVEPSEAYLTQLLALHERTGA